MAYRKWIWPGQTYHNIQVLLKYIITRRFTHAFFCDGHLRLCACCLRLRGFKFPRVVHSRKGIFMVY